MFQNITSQNHVESALTEPFAKRQLFQIAQNEFRAVWSDLLSHGVVNFNRDNTTAKLVQNAGDPARCRS